MLYITTRSRGDAFTVAKTLQTDTGLDGGRYVPMQPQQIPPEEMDCWLKKSYHKAIADMLNLFFATKLTGWDVEFAIGRTPIKMAAMNHRIFIAEVWHNQERTLEYMVTSLHRLVAQNDYVTDWSRIAISIAVLFGVFTQLQSDEESLLDNPVDIAVNTGDFSAPMVAWYARSMGLPVGNIICACNENSAVWDLLRNGTLSCAHSPVKTELPELDVAVPVNLERLVFATLGADRATDFANALENRSAFALTEEELPVLNSGLSVSVVGTKRVSSIIHKVYKTNAYVLDPYTALTFGGLQDYRANTGEGRATLLISGKSPACCKEMVASALGVSTG